MTDRRFLSLFLTVGDPNTYPEGTCTAWVESADRPCGKPADYLCARHVKVAQKRHAKAAQELRREREREDARRERLRPEREARLARIEAELDRLDPFRRDETPDTAQVNVPLAKRLPSEARIERLANLHKEREHLRRLLELPS